MRISWDLHKKSSEVSLKTRSTLASLSFISQLTKHTTAKWSVWNKIMFYVLYGKEKGSKKKRHDLPGNRLLLSCNLLHSPGYLPNFFLGENIRTPLI